VFILKLLFGVAIIIAVLYGAHRLHRKMSGRGDSGGLVSAGIRKARGTGENDLEQFISEFRARGGNSFDPTLEHKLGLELHQPASKKVALGPNRLIFLLLKSSLTDHHVFPNARISDFIQDPPSGLASERVDFLLCNRAFDVKVVVDLKESTPADADGSRRADLFHALSLRYVRLDLVPLPKPQQIRDLVLG
jgi:hypothetical protein